MEDTPTERGDTVFIGSRHGSPNVVIALPFSQVVTDSHLRDDVMALAALVAELAGTMARPKVERRVELARIQAAAAELAERVGRR
jgi:hypothetical protein